MCDSFCRYDTDKNGYVDHREFLAKLGGELAPGDIHGPSTLIAEQSQQVMESMYQKQQVSYNLFGQVLWRIKWPLELKKSWNGNFLRKNFFPFHQDMHMAATWNQAQAASFLSALEVEQQLRWEFVYTFCL